jgi:hypothetical protein
MPYKEELQAGGKTPRDSTRTQNNYTNIPLNPV